MSEIVEIASPGEILVIAADGAQTQIVIEALGEIEVLEVAEQGPAGPPGAPGPPGPVGPAGPTGSSEEDMAYAKRVDFVGDTLIYRGEAPPGTADSVPAWRIRRITIGGDDGDVTEQWAAAAAFTQVWADRLSLDYQ